MRALLNSMKCSHVKAYSDDSNHLTVVTENRHAEKTIDLVTGVFIDIRVESRVLGDILNIQRLPRGGSVPNKTFVKGEIYVFLF